MTRNTQTEDEKSAAASSGKLPKPEPPAWQIAVPFFVTLFALIGLVVFIYGLYTAR